MYCLFQIGENLELTKVIFPCIIVLLGLTATRNTIFSQLGGRGYEECVWWALSWVICEEIESSLFYIACLSAHKSIKATARRLIMRTDENKGKFQN